MKTILVASLSVLLVSCNPEEYYPVEEFVLGSDAYCSEAQDRNSCQDLGDRCQAAFLDLEKDDQEPIFAACIANPGYSDPSVPSEPTDPSVPGDPTVPGDTSEPSINDAIKSKCENLGDQYLYVKKLVSKKKTEIVKKVKVCHSTDRSEHTIIIACPALKAHAKHHDGADYLGACK